MNKIIKSSADCSIKQFMECAFKENYKVLLIEGDATDAELKVAFEYVYAEYVDFSGLYTTREFELTAYIHSLDVRIQTVKRFTELQREFLNQFGCPFMPGLVLIKKYGHKLYWDFKNPDKKSFLDTLDRVENSEKKYVAQLDGKIKELIDLNKKKSKGEHSLLENRKQFITSLNRLQQARFVIDKEKTTVEELAMMIKDHREQIEAQKFNPQKKY